MNAKWFPVWLVGLALLAYANSFTGDFIFDSRPLILEDPRVREVSAGNLRESFTKEYWWPRAGQGLYRPLSTLSYLFNYAVLGNANNPLGYHVLNFLLHVGNVLLVWLLARRFLSDEMGAFFAAGLFALHPVTTEAVTNIIGRSDLLVGLAVLGGLWIHVRHGEEKRWWPVLSVVYLAGLLSKESAVVLPACMLLYDLLYRGQKRLGAYLALVPAVGIWLMLRAHALEQTPPIPFGMLENSLLEGTQVTARLTALTVVGRYLLLLLWPARLSADYSYREIPLVSWGDWTLWVSVAGLIGIVVWAIRKRGVAMFGVGFFFLALLPVSNLIVFAGTPMAERFLYLPLFGFALLAGWAGAKLAALTERGQRLMVLVMLGVLLALGIRTHLRNEDWQTHLGFWLRMVETAPQSYRAHSGLAHVLQERGAMESAVYEIEQALQIAPEAFLVLENAGEIYRQMGDAQPAGARREWYEKSLAVLIRARDLMVEAQKSNEERIRQAGRDPNRVPSLALAPVNLQLAVTYLKLDRAKEALSALQQSRRLSPTNPDVYYWLGEAYRSAGNVDAAVIHFWQVTFISPDPGAAYQALSELYRIPEWKDCALIEKEDRFEINLKCDLVRGHICLAFEDLAQGFEYAGKLEYAAQARQRAIRQFGCNMGAR